MAPVKALYEKSREVRFWRFCRVDGMVPVRLLWARMKICRLVKPPIEEGMEEEMEAEVKSMDWRLERVPNQSGMLPGRGN